MTGNAQELDKQMLVDLGADKLADLLLLHLRTLWTVDGLYFVNIEDAHGTEEATRIDANVWEITGKIEARRLKQFLGIQGDADLKTAFNANKLSGWALDLEGKEYSELKGDKMVMKNLECRIQKTRLSKDLGEFPCKKVRYGFLQAFFKEMNPNLQVDCIHCPPDEHPEGVWCHWEVFEKKE
jgi:hypothetical protein